MLRPGSRLSLAAPAKLNLTLEIRGKRPDGYHELVSVMQTLELADEVELEITDEHTEIRLEVSGPEANDSIPTDIGNLAHRAATLYRANENNAQARGVEIRLLKNVPACGGLGGGSSDAAAVLRGLAQLDQTPLSDGELHALAATLGSDVNLFLTGGTVLALGRGERTIPLPDLTPFDVTLAMPPFGVSTPSVFGVVDARPFLALSEREDARQHGLFTQAFDSASYAELESNFHNDLEWAARRVEPRLDAWLDDGWHLCGSGSTVFRFGAHAHESPSACSSESIRFLTTRSRKR